MEILLPKETNIDWQELLNQVVSNKPMSSFNHLILLFIQEFSCAIINNKEFIQYPESIAMAQWFCEARLNELYQSYELRRKNRIWLPRGVVLHFAPINVDSLFIDSWFLSLLVGNVNIVRLSQDRSKQVHLLLNVLNSILEQERFKEIRERNLIVSYGHDELTTKKLSEFCHVRIIWGGDETIRQIRSIPLPPRTTELVFADRFSMAAIKADAVLQSLDNEINNLAKAFFRDTFRFNQSACSSPRFIFWIGEEEDISRAKNYFWTAFEKVMYQENLDWNEGVGISRMVAGYRYVAEGIADKLSTPGIELPYRVHVKNYKENLREIHSGGGLFLETEKSNLMGILELITFKDQTLAVFGFSKNELEEFAWKLGGRGIDRIVPIGQALSFQIVWDGYDILTYLTREVTISGEEKPTSDITMRLP